MFKYYVLAASLMMAMNAFAEVPCDIRPGTSMGIKVIEFATGNKVHSKMTFKEGTPDALLEEMINLQDMGICEEKIKKHKCILKFEKIRNANYISLYRGGSKWNTWHLRSKAYAEQFVRNLKKAGFCS